MGQSLVKNYGVIKMLGQCLRLLHSSFLGVRNDAPMAVIAREERPKQSKNPVSPNFLTGPDHVHILCKLSQKIAWMKLVEQVKSNSSKWIKTLDPGLEQFYWQDGYGAFSVNAAGVSKVVAYIANQHRHHAGEDFQSEYRGILNTNGVEYDERYVWD